MNWYMMIHGALNGPLFFAKGQNWFIFPVGFSILFVCEPMNQSLGSRVLTHTQVSEWFCPTWKLISLHGILTSVRWDQTHTTMLLQPKQISGIIRYHKHSYWKWWFSIVFCMFTRSYPLFWTNKPSGVIKHGNRESASNVLMIFPAVNYRTQNLSKWRFLGKNHVFSLK